MAKSNTEAKEKPPKNKLRKVADEKFERPFIDPPEEDGLDGKDSDPGDFGALPPFSNQERTSLPKSDSYRIEITKGKLLKGDKVEIEYTKRDSPDSKPAECSEKHTDPPRPEFKKAFANLAIHAALIGEFIPLTHIDDLTDPRAAEDFNVSGFTCIGEDEDAGVILTAQKTLKSGKTLGFNTPIIRFNDISENPYPRLDELLNSIDLCRAELKLYLSGKHAPDPQLSLDLE